MLATADSVSLSLLATAKLIRVCKKFVKHNTLVNGIIYQMLICVIYEAADIFQLQKLNITLTANNSSGTSLSHRGILWFLK